MKPQTSTKPVLSVILAFAGLLFCAAAPSAQAQSTSIFSIVPSPNASTAGNVFNAVTALSPNDA